MTLVRVTDAFKSVLETAQLGVPVYAEMPYEGAEQRSVVLTIVSGWDRSPSIGLRHSKSSSALEERYRLQIDCYHDDQTEVKKLADKVMQAIADRLDLLRATYDIHGVRRLVITQTQPPESMVRESRILLDYEFYTHRALS